MTGKEAIRLVASWPESRVRMEAATTRDNTLRRVCDWWLTERDGFEALAALVGMPPAEPEAYGARYAVGGSPHATKGQVETVHAKFEDWRSITEVAQELGIDRSRVQKVLKDNYLRSRRKRLERRNTEYGLQWRIVPHTEGGHSGVSPG